MLWQALSAVHDLGRLHDIAVVLIRYGFGDQVRRIGLAGALERAGPGAPGAGSTGADLHQAGTNPRHPRRSVTARMDRRLVKFGEKVVPNAKSKPLS